MEQKAGAQISQRAFIQSLVILFVLMMIAGALTLILPAGQYTRLDVDGRSAYAISRGRITAPAQDGR